MKHIDKVYHFTAGFIIYILSNILMNDWWSMVPVIVIGAGKELYDYYSKKGTPDWWDFIWTVIGGLILLILSI
jgi:hypothetical protein